MKKVVSALFIFLGLAVIFYFFGPFTIKTVCFGDVCPDNGGTYVFYKKNYSKKECLAIKGDPIVGFGWGEVYAGCSPNSYLSIQSN